MAAPSNERASGRARPGGWGVRAALSLGAVLVVAIPGTTAAWVDPVPVTGASVTAGTVDLKVQGSDSVTGYTTLNLSAMEPGDTTAGVLTVSNSGTAPLRYYVDAAVTNADSKGLGASLTAKVTGDSSTSGSTCPGGALSGTGTSFGASLVGSSASPRTLAGGTSETLCVQAKLPDGGTAQAAATTISFTFNASTGAAAAPGWTDSVGVSGTSLSTANAFYLGSAAFGSGLELRRTGPTAAGHTGVSLASTGPQANRQRKWVYQVPAGGVILSGIASLRVWTAVTGFSTTASGALSVTLSDCDGTGAACNDLVTTTTSSGAGSWSGGSNTWVAKTLPITTTANSRPWAGGRSIVVTVTNVGANPISLAFDSTSFRSALFVQ